MEFQAAKQLAIGAKDTISLVVCAGWPSMLVGMSVENHAREIPYTQQFRLSSSCSLLWRSICSFGVWYTHFSCFIDRHTISVIILIFFSVCVHCSFIYLMNDYELATHQHTWTALDVDIPYQLFCLYIFSHSIDFSKNIMNRHAKW